MDFNPLDLLASAAELQKKNDDSDLDVTMVTHQRHSSGNTKPVATVVQKENKEVRTVNNNKNINNNNNNTIKGKSVIIRKIKVGANTDLEKMLNEHNYGNAKKNFESSIKVVFEDGGRNRAEAEDVSSESPVDATPTVGHTLGKNVPAIKLASKEDESPSGNVKSNELNKKDVVDTFTCKLSDTNSTEDSSSASLESSKCVHKSSDFDCPGASRDDEHVSSENVLESDKIEGHVQVHSGGSQSLISDSIQDVCDSEKGDDTSVVTSPDTCVTSVEGNDHIINTEISDVQAIGEENINEGVKQQIVLGTLSQNEETLSISIDPVHTTVTNSSNVFVRDTKSTESHHKVSTSDLRRTPYVNVSVKQSSPNSGNDGQPLMISINGKNSKNSEKDLSSEKSVESVGSNYTEHIEQKTDSGLEIIRTLLTSDKQCEKTNCVESSDREKAVDMVSSKPMKLDISKCDRFDLGGPSENYESLKNFELNESICGDSSTGSVHLLSPDRRNPDSVGIAESPVTSQQQDVPVIQDLEPNQENVDFLNDEVSSINSETCDLLSEQGIKEKTVTRQQNSDMTDNVKGCKLLLTNQEKGDNKSANDSAIFRFEYDHSYAGLPGKVNFPEVPREQDSLSQSEDSVRTPLGSAGGGDLSQDSGYEDITHSPVSEPAPVHNSPGALNATDSMVPQSQNLVPVLVSINDNGSLTLHSDHLLQKTVQGPVFSIQDNGTSKTLDSGVKLLSGTNLTPLSPTPLLLSPIKKIPGSPNTSTMQQQQHGTEGVLGLLRPTTPDINPTAKPVQASPPKFGKFRIGTFASFSNTGMKIEEPPKLFMNKTSSQEKTPRSSNSKKNSLSHGSSSGKASPAVDTLGTLVQKVRSSLSPSSQIETKHFNVDHIHHDHDYCMKNLMPSVVSSVLEAKLQKELTKSKQAFTKSKKIDVEQVSKHENKYGKRKRTSSNAGKEEFIFESVLAEDTDCNGHDFIRPKSRAERYIEQKSSEPKVKITGSSNFQDQFVYFMNTKKRSRRRESRDSPIPVPLDKLFIPPKPGDIIVPHLTDQDIEILKQRSKQKSGQSSYNSLRIEFMASKLANVPFSAHAQPESADDEKSIINTILSLENENLVEPEDPEQTEPYNESMEMYGQGLGADIMNLTPEQMNLTQEQMDLLFSAVDEVQNSSPGLIGGEKLHSTENGDSTFGQFPDIENNLQSMSTRKSSGSEDKVENGTVAKTRKVSEDMEPATSMDCDDNEGKEASNPDTSDNGEKSEEPTPDQSTEQLSGVSVPDTDTVNKGTDPDSSATTTTDSESVQVSTNEEEKVPSAGEQSQVPAEDDDDDSTIDTSAGELPSVGSPYSKPNFGEVSGLPDQTAPQVSNGILPANLPNNSGIPLQTLERGPLDLLSNDFRLDKNDLFTENSVPTTPASSLTPHASPHVPSDYSAPWIVTVSMYWNDLPAIMMQNQPYVRLVDIHKQILPAKDTGILKKRCQLMGIRVENCSEMQRYFLVQYGKAFNSKSTLIVSKESANELIGYYVDPQPKTSRVEEHTGKSVIEHRREQLRRIALARRAEIRARQTAERREDDPRAIKEPVSTPELEPSPVPDTSKVEIEVPKVLPAGIRPPAPLPAQVPSPGVSTQRSTRHKKINFLEMLRGDSASGTGEGEILDEAPQVKKPTPRFESGDSAVKKVKRSQEKKIKIVKYSVQPKVQEDSSETETDCSSNEETDSTSGSEIYIVKKNSFKPRKMLQNEATRFKPKSKLKLAPIKKSPPRLPLKVKICTKRPNKPSSAPVSVNRSVGTLAAPYSTHRRDRLESPHNESYSSDDLLSHRVLTPSVVNNYGATSSHTDENKTLDAILKFDRNNGSEYEKVKVMPNYSEDLHVSNFGGFGSRSLIKEFTEADLKVSQSLPSEILDTSGMQEVETNTDTEEAESVNVAPGNSEEIYNKCDETDSVNGVGENTTHVLVRSDSVELPIDTNSRSQSPLINVSRCESSSCMDVGLPIIHRDSSPVSEGRGRSQLGELFSEKYSNKKSLCIRCYTCRKMMSVDLFLRHLHDVSGGFIPVEGPRSIDLGDNDLDEQGVKLWESFLRKKELFDNNHVPSPDVFSESVLCNVDFDSNHSYPRKTSVTGSNVKTSAGPRIITTPVTSVKTSFLSSRHVSVAASSRKGIQSSINDGAEGTRSSSRKRKKKQLYPCEEYSFSKFPRLQSGCEKTESNE